MGKILYFECYSGISGDMTVAALLDLGADAKVLENVLCSLDIDGFKTSVTRVTKSGLDVCDFDVVMDHPNHDHDMDYLYGNRVDSHEHVHGAKPGDAHNHRGLREIIGIIRSADMTPNAKIIAEKVFNILGKSEAKAHGVPIEDVHFHEVGAIDSIIDVISFSVCIDNLGIDEIAVSDLYEGRGFVRCQHGVIPVPVPAVSNIVIDCGLNLHIMDVDGEYVTPTGAAMMAAVRNRGLPKAFRVSRVGMGGGKRITERSGILRAMILDDSDGNSDGNSDRICKMECNVDDCSGEVLGHTMERLFKAGARDVYYIPAFMKKNRPAYLLCVICAEADVRVMESIIFEETTTIGIRRTIMDRTIMSRELVKVMTHIGEAVVKVCTIGLTERCYPEYDSVVSLCKISGLPYDSVYQIVRSAYLGNKG